MTVFTSYYKGLGISVSFRTCREKLIGLITVQTNSLTAFSASKGCGSWPSLPTSLLN